MFVKYVLLSGGSIQTINGTGSYAIRADRTANLTFENVKQIDDITEPLWGITGMNWCKNLVFDGCSLSRFDSNFPAQNMTVRNCEIGWWSIQITGHGKLIVDNCNIYSGRLVGLTEDYGAGWDGDVKITNCTLYPQKEDLVLFTGINKGKTHYSYTVALPEITIENLRIADGDSSVDSSSRIAVFDDITAAALKAPYARKLCKKVTISGCTVDSGRKIVIANDAVPFASVDFQVN